MELMSGLDSRFLFSETPAAHMHTVKVAIVDVSGRSDALTPDRQVEVIEDRLARMPVLRRRVIPIPFGLGYPAVIDDADFDLRHHLRHQTLAPPGEQSDLDAVVAAVASEPLSWDRPLWELTIVDGLAGDHIAYVVKIHHALADGVSAVSLLTNAFVTDDAEAIVEPFRPEPSPSTARLYRAAASGAVRNISSVPSVLGRSITGTIRGRAARRGEPTTVPGPFSGPKTPFNVSLTPERTFATATLPLDTLSAAKQRAEASLNDVFLAVCGGGVRRYLSRTDDLPPTSLVASVPMATRMDRRVLGGNHVDNLYLPLRTDVAGPIDRIRKVHVTSAAARRVRTALGTELMEDRAGLIPPLAHRFTTRAWSATGLADRVRPPLNLVASSVPGPRETLELDGGVVTALYSSGPILEGIGVNITAWSYLDTMYLSILGCPASLPDPSRLTEAIAAEMSELAAAL